MVAALTPFTAGGHAVDEPALRELIRFLVRSGVHGLFPCGSNGEGLLLSPEERMRVAEVVVEEAAGKVPVVVHTGHMSAHVAVRLTRHAREIGAAAAAMITPYYYPLDDAALQAYFLEVARAVEGFPVYPYNFPGASRNDIKPRLFADLFRVQPNIAGIKDSSKDVARLQGYAQAAGPDATLMVGADDLVMAALAVGASGVVSTVANVYPHEVVRVYECFRSGDLDGARQAQQHVNRLREALKSGPYIASYKAALRLRGINGGSVRPPLRDATEEEARALEARLRAIAG